MTPYLHEIPTGTAAQRTPRHPGVAPHGARSMSNLAGHLTPENVAHLQRSGGNAVVAALLRDGSTQVQRTLKGGTDPVPDLQDPTKLDLVYGGSTTRGKTLARAGALPAGRRITIDKYNDDIGLSSLNNSEGATCIFALREALAPAQPELTWANYFPNAIAGVATDADLVAWIHHMKANLYYAGLYNLGRATGTDWFNRKTRAATREVNSKYRFQKNFIFKTDHAKTTLKPKHIALWLRADRTYAAATGNITTMFTKKQRDDLEIWVRKALFRRTSKMGIDFTIARGATVHFDVSGDPAFDMAKATAFPTWNMQVGGLEAMRLQKQKYGRMITTSELRHIRKLGIHAAGQVNEYDEW